ncbi:MAG: protein kinase [Proteobacteria bacterium]|nr:protein kinase [Pseudomonadota bacterium]
MGVRLEPITFCFRDSERYKNIRQIGSGGMGVVFEVVDLVRGHSVALKTHIHRDSDSLYRFKNEFRSIADVSHPNLVTLYDLVVEENLSFYTMELIDGVDFVTYSTLTHSGPQHKFDEQRLRVTLSQLADGIGALHAADKVHRDIKPSNILVAKEGRVVVLDFGLVITSTEKKDITQTEHAAGTASYMAPEQAVSDSEVIRASDFYSIGIVLYQTLTGRLPFQGNAVEIFQSKQHLNPKEPRSLNPDVPDDLNELCIDLLQRDPYARPDTEEIKLRIKVGQESPASPSFTTRPLPLERPVFVGRETELSFLDEQFERAARGEFALVLIRGESGIGKSALAHEFIRRIEENDSGLKLLQGRCYERETVPYKAMDGLIDNLSRTWKNLDWGDAAYIWPQDADLLLRLFPVLGRVSQISQVPGRFREIEDLQELRSRGFSALRETFQRLTNLHRLVLFLDDLQWVDMDTVNLLSEIVKQPDPPALMMLLASRYTSDASSPLDRLLETSGENAKTIELGPLSEEETRELASELTEDEQYETIDRLARESRGSPFFAEQLARVLADDRDQTRALNPGSLLKSRLENLPSEASNMLQLLAIAGEPLDPGVAARAAGIDQDIAVKTIRSLTTSHLASTTPGQDDDRIEPYHDRIRQEISNNLQPDQRKARHRALAHALEQTTPIAHGPCAIHWQGAGEPAKSARHAQEAAVQADIKLAFDRAARFYELCLNLGDHTKEQDCELRAKLGEALANAGRGAESANAYLEAAQKAEPSKALIWQEKGAYQLLVSGRINEGIIELTAVLKAYGLKMPKTPRRAIMGFLWERTLMKLRRPRLGFTERKESEIPPEQLALIDVCWSATVGLIGVEHVRSFYFQACQLRHSLAAGDSFRIACGLCLEAFLQEMISENPNKGEKILRIAEQWVKVSDRSYAYAYHASASGLISLVKGHWKEAFDSMTHGISIFKERCIGGYWEIHTVSYLACASLFYLGRLKDLELHVRNSVDYSYKRGNLYAITMSKCTEFSNFVWLMKDDVLRAKREAQEAMSCWRQTGFHLQHMFDLFSQVQMDLYQGNSTTVWQRMTDFWKPFAASGLFNNKLVRIETNQIRAQAALCAAASVKDRKTLLRQAAKSAKRLMRERRQWATGLSMLISAQIAAAQDREQDALEAFSDAEKVLESADMAMHATAARYGKGLLLKGDEGEALVSSARSFLTDQDVKKPDKLFGIIVPWMVAAKL